MIEAPQYNYFYPSEDEPFNIDLQWFAAEDEGRTEEPTARKIRKAREEGKAAKSNDMTAAIVMIFGLLMVYVLSSRCMRIFVDMIHRFITEATDNNMAYVFSQIPFYLLSLALPVVLICFIAAIFGNVVQVGFLFSTKPITPDFSRIAPNFAKWAQRSFFSGEAAFNLLKSIVKIGVIAVLAYLNIRAELPELTSAVKLTSLNGISLITGICIRIMLQTAIFLLIFAIPDYFFQRNQHRESLKMSKRELREEFKEMEGDPLIRNRLRQRMQEVLAASMSKQVPEADVVITNPTHFAVALKWESQRMQAPVVTAKGRDEIALRIKEIAKKADVPTVENRPLARALYDNVELGDEVPEDYWDVVSMVLAEVYKLNGKVV